MVVISRDTDGRWYATLAVDVDQPAPAGPAGAEIGVDLGVKDFAVLSTGERIANPRHLERKARNLARYQRRMARCQRGSANRRKARAKVAAAHRKVRAGTCSPRSPSGRATGRVPTAAPGTTGTSTPPRTSLRLVES
ncbi:transposase [Plantactinospora sp. DSM 117369]